MKNKEVTIREDEGREKEMKSLCHEVCQVLSVFTSVV
jgi:hypothetical protein